MCRLFLFIVALFFSSCYGNSLKSSDISVQSIAVQTTDANIKSVIKIKVPTNWKISQPPYFITTSGTKIKVLNSTQTNANEYRCELIFDKNMISPVVRASFAACSDICVFANKEFKLDLSKDFGFPLSAEKSNIWYMIVLAILGGLILNCMPCVLPVLAIKLRSFSKNISKSHLLYTFLGIFVSFLGLATSISLLKLFGYSVGWGMHFQNANFLNISAVLVFLLILYSFNRIKFDISLKTEVSEKNEFIKNFISGVVATLLAIPCTAPLLGTAATFALQGSISDIYIIFLSIAFGFGSPYLLGYFIKLPSFIRPGAWMEKIKWILNFGIFLTFLWLLWLLSNHLYLYQLVCLLALYSILFVSAGKYKVAFWAALILALSIPNITDNKHHIQDVYSDTWRPFDQETLDKYIKDKHVVFVNITADWCMTCHYNKVMVLKNSEFMKLVQQNKIRLLEGDITYPNDKIREFLVKHNRSGIPFNIVFGPAAPNGIPLSVIPSISEIKSAIEKAVN